MLSSSLREEEEDDKQEVGLKKKQQQGIFFQERLSAVLRSGETTLRVLSRAAMNLADPKTAWAVGGLGGAVMGLGVYEGFLLCKRPLHRNSFR